MKQEWVLLIYKIPPQPTRLRAQIWRALQRCGAVYLQDSVSIVPATTELGENMQWLADEIRELGGTAYVFRASTTMPEQDARIEARFRDAGGAEALRLVESLRSLEARLDPNASAEACAAMEDELRRLRQAALKLRARTHFPIKEEEALQRRLRTLRDRMDRLALRATRRRGRP